MTQSDMWIVDQVTVKRGGREEVEFVPKELAWIKCPAKCSITIMNPKPGIVKKNCFNIFYFKFLLKNQNNSSAWSLNVLWK